MRMTVGALAAPLLAATIGIAAAQGNSCSAIMNNAERLACYDAAAKTSAAPVPMRTGGDDAPYSLRGFQLGITLDDFRKVPYPDREKYPSGHAICTQDKEKKSLTYPSASQSQLEPSGLFGRAGVVICRFYIYTRDMYAAHAELRKYAGTLTKKSANELTEGFLDFAGVGGQPTTFMFTPATLAKEKATRLFSIRVGLNNKHFDEVVTALKAKYGEPSGKATSLFKTMIGAQFENLTITWANGTSTIIVEKYADTLDVMSVSFLHGAFLLEANKAAEEAGKALGGKL
jgi:hypothetical protein